MNPTMFFAPLLALVMVAGACSTSDIDEDASPASAAEITINGETTMGSESTTDAMSTPVEPAAMAAVDGTSAASSVDLRQRCIEGIRVLDRRWYEEDFEYPDEGNELSEEELERTLAPVQPFTDGVAAPYERATFSESTDFDPETLPIPQLDRFRESCLEQGLVTEEEIYGEDDEGEGDGEDSEGEGEDGWCEELASFAREDLEEFAAEEGPDSVREEFEACGLPNPLDS